MQQGMSDYVLKKFQPIEMSLQEYGTWFFFFFFPKQPDWYNFCSFVKAKIC